jgi:hypothetical protein
VLLFTIIKIVVSRKGLIDLWNKTKHYVYKSKCIAHFWKCFSSHIVLQLWFRSLPLYDRYTKNGLHFEKWSFIVIHFLSAEHTQHCKWDHVLQGKQTHWLEGLVFLLEWTALINLILNHSQMKFLVYFAVTKLLSDHMFFFFTLACSLEFVSVIPPPDHHAPEGLVYNNRFKTLHTPMGC